MSMIAEVTSVSSKGQVVLPKTIREKLSLDAGSKLIVVTDGANILLKPIIAPTLNEFEELMKESQKWAKEVGMTEDDIDEAI
ncbi:MAG: AbrB/MazE/SpoVT family DNA-binding domain-containing protein, partial [Lachnospiraceae bacterium]|nr:AbrB/MazE/SpoVT family DNA-binding domain-containing protein [Lachnospiraceae bacterium]